MFICKDLLHRKDFLTILEKGKNIMKFLLEKWNAFWRHSFFSHPLTKMLFPTILIAVIGWMGGFVQLPKNVENMETKMDEISKRIETIEEDIKRHGNEISTLNGSVYHPTKIIPTKDYMNAFVFSNSSNIDISLLEAPKWNSSDIIAVDYKNHDTKYKASDLSDKKIMCPYLSDDGEVYFYGQFNGNNHWDGECIINVYKDNILTLVTDAIYDDGELVSYKQILPYKTQSGSDVWCVANRSHTELGNYGESWNYYKENDIIKSFNFDNVTPQDIISTNSFRYGANFALEAYYCGQTSDGVYNDNTGTAYLVKYDRDGTIKTVYRGNFTNGQFDDSTGEAWEIARDNDPTYIYYKGRFKDGKAVHEKRKRNISLEEIKKVVKPYQFNCDLKWFGDVEESIL